MGKSFYFLFAVAEFVVIFCTFSQYHFVMFIDNLLYVVPATVAQFHRVLVYDLEELVFEGEDSIIRVKNFCLSEVFIVGYTVIF